MKLAWLFPSLLVVGNGYSSVSLRQRRLASRQLQLPPELPEYVDPNCEPRVTPYNVSEHAARPTASDIVQLADNATETFVSYLDLPSDTHFVESIAYNPKFAHDTAYLVIQRPYSSGSDEPSLASFLYAVRPATGELEAISETPLSTVVDDQGTRTTDISVWGTALTSDGRLVAAVYNRNSVLVFDLTLQNDHVSQAVQEIPQIAARNDLAVDPNDESIVYVAAGSFQNITHPIETIYSNTILGRVMRVNLETQSATPILEDLSVVAGIEVVGTQIWVSQLFDVVVYDTVTDTVTQAWDGANPDTGRTWLADNLDLLYNKDDGEATTILTPAWGAPTATFLVDTFAKDKCTADALAKLNQVQASLRTGESLEDALLDPETPAVDSQTFLEEEDLDEEPQPVRIITIDAETGDAMHYEISLVATNANNPPFDVKDPFTGEILGQRRYFNEQVTHVTHIPSQDGVSSGHLVAINFEVPRLMIIEDTLILQSGNIDSDVDEEDSSSATSSAMIPVVAIITLLIMSL